MHDREAGAALHPVEARADVVAGERAALVQEHVRVVGVPGEAVEGLPQVGDHGTTRVRQPSRAVRGSRGTDKRIRSTPAAVAPLR